MSPADLTTALTEVRDAVEAPAVDRVAFQARVRTERRRRTATRATLAVTGLAAAAAVVAGTVHALPRDEGTPVASAAPVEVDDPTQVVGFVVEDRLVVGGPAGFTVTDVPARNVLGVLDRQLIQADQNGALVAVPVSAEGVAGPAEEVATIDRAYLDRSGARIIVETGGLYSAWSPSAPGGTDLPSLDDGQAVEGGLTAIDGDVRVVSGPDRPVLVGPSGAVRTLPATSRSEDLAPGLLATETIRGVRFYDTGTGRLLARVHGDGTGSLAPDGSAYARSSASGLALVDPRTGRWTPVTSDVDGTPDQIAWTGPDTFVVTARDDDGTGTLQECDAAERTCRLLYEDPSGTLKLTS